jgi:hypothetical protein
MDALASFAIVFVNRNFRKSRVPLREVGVDR